MLTSGTNTKLPSSALSELIIFHHNHIVRLELALFIRDEMPIKFNKIFNIYF